MSWLKSVLGFVKKKEKKITWSEMRPVVLDPFTRGVSDVAKLPTLPFFGYKLIYEMYLYSDLLRTIIRSLVQETVRKGITIKHKFAVKCNVCGTEYDTEVQRCKICRSDSLRKPSEIEYRFLEKFIYDANFNDQSLAEVISEVDTDLNLYDNAYICVIKKYYFNKEGEVIGAEPIEVVRASPESVEIVMDSNGRYGRTDDGRIVMICLEHRDRMEVMLDEEVENARCKECGKKMYPAYFRVRKYSPATQNPYIYYVNGEILHIKKFTHGIGYGVSPVYAVWSKIMILMKMDYFILTAYHLERSPKGLLILRGNIENLEKAWRRLMEEAKSNPHIIYPLIVEGSEEAKRIAEYIDLSFSSRDIDFISYREEVRRTVGALWGVMPIFQGEPSGGIGIANEGLQIIVTNRAVEREQHIFNDKVLPWLTKQLGVNDWELQLVPNEGRDVVARIQRERMRIDNALSMMQMGYKPVAVKTEDGIDFDFIEMETGESLPKVGGGEIRELISSRKIQKYEGEPEHGKPRVKEQRFEGEELGRRPKVKSFVVGEGGELIPEEEVSEEMIEKMFNLSKAVNLVKQEVGEIPYEYRRYIKRSDISKLPQGVRVYRGARGGLYIDEREIGRAKLEEFGIKHYSEEEYVEERSEIDESVEKVSDIVPIKDYKSIFYVPEEVKQDLKNRGHELYEIWEGLRDVSKQIRHAIIEGDESSFAKHLEDYVESLAGAFQIIYWNKPKSAEVMLNIVKKFGKMLAISRGYGSMDFEDYCMLWEALERRRRGNKRIGFVDMRKRFSDMEKMVRSVSEHEYESWVDFSRKMFEKHVLKGEKRAKLYRGLSSFEANELILRGLLGMPLKVSGTVISTTVDRKVAERFADSGIVAWFYEDGERVVGGWWNASDVHGDKEREIIISGDEGGTRINGIDLLEDDPYYNWIGYILRGEKGEIGEMLNSETFQNLGFSFGNIVGQLVGHYLETYHGNEFLQEKFAVTEDKVVEALDKLESVVDEAIKVILSNSKIRGEVDMNVFLSGLSTFYKNLDLVSYNSKKDGAVKLSKKLADMSGKYEKFREDIARKVYGNE